VSFVSFGGSLLNDLFTSEEQPALIGLKSIVSELLVLIRLEKLQSK